MSTLIVAPPVLSRTEREVLARSLRARTALLLAGADARKAPVDTGVLLGPDLPMICDLCESPMGAVGTSPCTGLDHILGRSPRWTCTCAEPIPYAPMASYTAHYLNPVGHRIPGTTRTA